MQKFTEIEQEKGYANCKNCSVHFHILQAGFEVRHVICEKCGFSVVPVIEFNKTMDAIEILSK